MLGIRMPQNPQKSTLGHAGSLPLGLRVLFGDRWEGLISAKEFMFEQRIGNQIKKFLFGV